MSRFKMPIGLDARIVGTYVQVQIIQRAEQGGDEVLLDEMEIVVGKLLAYKFSPARDEITLRFDQVAAAVDLDLSWVSLEFYPVEFHSANAPIKRS